MSMTSKRSLFTILPSLILAIGVTTILLWQYPIAHSTVAIVKVTNRPSHTLFPHLHPKLTAHEIKRFENAQLETLRSKYVIQSALNRRDIAQLNAVKEREPDPVEWLRTELHLSFPSGSGVLELRYEGPQDTEEMKRILSAIIAAFEHDVVGYRRIKREDQRAKLAKLSSDLSDELKEELDNYYALSEELNFELTGKSSSFYIATTEELGNLTDSLNEFMSAIEDGKVDAAQELIDSIPNTWYEATEPPAPKFIPDAELTMLRGKIERLQELNDKVYLRLRQWEIEDRLNSKPFRILQPPLATENTRNVAESVGIAVLGGLSTFVLTVIVLTLMGKLLC